MQKMVSSCAFLSLAILQLALSSCWGWSWSLFIPSFRTQTQTRHQFRPNDSLETIDNYFMDMALKEANRASTRRNEVPIGAVVVVRRTKDSFDVLSTASNRVETMHDATAHAEVLALRKAARKIKNWRLLNTTLYTTLEPCPMCLSASLNFRVSRIVYGALDHRLGAIETLPNNLMEQHPFHTIDDIQAGVRQDESASLLRSFFQRRRRTNTSKKKP